MARNGAGDPSTWLLFHAAPRSIMGSVGWVPRTWRGCTQGRAGWVMHCSTRIERSGSIMVIVSQPKARVRHSSSTRRQRRVTCEMSFGYGARAADVVHGASRRTPYAPIEGIGTPSNSIGLVSGDEGLSLEAGLPESTHWSGGTAGRPPRVGTCGLGAGTRGWQKKRHGWVEEVWIVDGACVLVVGRHCHGRRWATSPVTFA